MYDKKLRLFFAALGLIVLVPASFLGLDNRQIEAKGRGRQGFGTASLRGSYASNGKADGFASRSVGVTYFDGKGNMMRTVRINANDGEGGRRLIDLSSVGTYSINRDGTGVMYLTNTNSSGAVSEVTLDFVVRESTRENTREKDDDAPHALVIAGIQREPGMTASLIEESFTYQFGE